MRCDRADRVELDAFLLGATGDEAVESFREHYPECGECAAAVADWMALDGALREVVAETGDVVVAHPEPDDLAGYAEAPARMGEKAMQIENHLAGCPRCANEMKLIRSFDPAMFGPQSQAMPALARDRVQPGLFDALGEALAGFVEKLRGFDLMSPAPAFALAVVVVAGLWWSGALAGLGGSRPESSEPQLVERAAPEAKSPVPLPGGGGSPGTTPGLSPELLPEPREPELQVAEEPPSTDPTRSDPTRPDATRSDPTHSDPTKVAASPTPDPTPEQTPVVEVAQATPEAAPKSGPPAGTPEMRPPTRPGPPKRQEEILLAAVSELPPPSYATPEGADSVVWMRQFGAVRSAPGAGKVVARAPGNHTGVTLSRTPRLWWALDQKTDLPVQITIVDGAAIDPLVRVELPGPHAAGLHAFDLSSQGVELSPGVDYRWFVSILADPDRPSRNPVSAGSLRVAGESDERRARVGTSDASARGNKFADFGLWYDAFDFYASLAAAHPEVEQLATYRDRLGEVVE